MKASNKADRELKNLSAFIQSRLADRRLAIIDSVLPTKASGEALRDLAKVYGVDPDMVSTVYRGGPDPEQADDLLREKIMAKIQGNR